MNIATVTGCFALAFGAMLVLTPVVRRMAVSAGAVARPSSDRWHRKPVPLLGGAAIAFATTGATIWFAGLDPAVVCVLTAALTMGLVGIVDDSKRLKPSTKLTAQIAVACAVIAQGVQLHWTSSPILDGFLTIFWFVAVTNAFNLLDNMDGLCAGVAGIAALAFCASGYGGNPAMLLAGAAVAGSAFGFLIFNFKPASIFMGDGGSMFLGTSLAVLSIAAGTGAARGVLSTLAVPALLVLIPIVDTPFVAVSRKLSARSASVGGRDHTSHRLVALGFSERQAVLTLYALAAMGGFTAVGLRHSELREVLLLGGVLLVGVLLLAVQLARVNVYAGEDFSLLREHRYGKLLVSMAYKRRVFEVLLDLGLISLAYYAAYALRFDRDLASYYESFYRSLPIVIATQLASFFIAGVYRGMWRYFSPGDIGVYVRAVLTAIAASMIALLL